MKNDSIFQCAWRERPQVLNNPVILRELIDRLRSNNAFYFLFFFLFISEFLFMIFLPYLKENNLKLAQGGRGSRELMLMFSVLQGFMILLISPLLSSTCVNIEKERKSWDLLITSPLNSASILLGKYLSSILFVLLLIASLIPIYSLVIPYGGVSPGELIFTACIMLELAITTGAIGLFCSIRWQRTTQSVSFTYIFVLLTYALPPALIMMNFTPTNHPLGPFIFISPLMIAFRIHGAEHLSSCSDTTALAVHFLFALGIVLIWGWIGIRTISYEPETRRPARKFRIYFTPLIQILRWFESGIRHINHRIIRSYSILQQKDWKNYLGKTDAGYIRSQMWIVIGNVLIVLLVLEDKTPFIKYIALCMYAAALIGPWFILPYGANCFRSEFDRNTWPLLAATTLSPKEIYLAKVKTGMSIFTGRIIALLAVPFSLLCIPFNWPMLLICLSFLPLFYLSARMFLGASILLSVHSSKTLTAYLVSFTFALLFLIVPSMALLIIEGSHIVSNADLLRYSHPFVALFSPFHFFVYLGFYKTGFSPKFIFQTTYSIHYILIYFTHISWLIVMTVLCKYSTIRELKKLMTPA